MKTNAPIESFQKCQYAGCRNRTAFILDNGHNRLRVCSTCAPSWVTSGQPSAFAKRFGRECYRVQKVA